MATLRTRWLLSIFLVNLPNCLFAPGPPAAPSLLDCCIPCGGINNCTDIHCSWHPIPDPRIPTNYSLHWEPANSEDGHVISGSSLSGVIQREHFSHGELHVWVQAKNQHGSSKSQKAFINTADIKKPPPPAVTLSNEESIEIDWTPSCDELHLSLGHCDVRHRSEADQVWLEDEGGIHGYTFDSPEPNTVYEFQVRCSCVPGRKSDWSAIHRIRSTEAAPVGKLDVWRDCGISQQSSDCVLTWKKLPVSQACGVILGYEVRLSYKNGTAVLVNMSTAEPRGRLVCEEIQCHFAFSLKDASSVSVSAYNAHGATVPSYLAMPTPELTKPNTQAIYLKMNEENLTASWDLPSQLSSSLKEYVMQYKQAGSPPGQGLDWAKVNKSQTTGFFKGQFKKYTPYQVSLFTVSHHSKVHHLSSVIGYSIQGTPSSVPSFTVFSIDTTHVTLFWEPVPLSKQNGVILYYQIVVDGGIKGQKVYNASSSPQHENRTFQLLHLSPGHKYEVRIRAVTAAGPGENATQKFETKSHEHLTSVVLGTISVAVLCIVVALYCVCHGGNKPCLLVPSCFYDKVPDARNSHIFRQMKHQMNDSLSWLCIPVNEPHPKISLLEIVEVSPWTFKTSPENKTSEPNGLTRPVFGDERSQMNRQDDRRDGEAVAEESHRTDHRYGKEEYSRMVDSDEERDRAEENREDCWSSSEEEQSTSGYEKHFMPTAFEVLEV